MIEILFAPLVASLVLAGIHCYLGLHIVSRGIIFADLALAQMAALGATVAILLGYHVDSTPAYIISLGFAFLGAFIFAVGRFDKEKIPQEAIIGMVYGVSSALAVLVLQKSPHGSEELERMLVGNILFVSWEEVLRMMIIYSIVGLIHYIFRGKFFALTMKNGLNGRDKIIWDFVFFITFSFVVTSSVKVAGILLVFSYLVIPAIAAMFFMKSISGKLIFGWIFGSIGSLLGVIFSAKYDFPTGASIIAVLAMMFIVTVIVQRIVNRLNDIKAAA
ncbi:MAG: metal ABC transporter permease [Acidobacteria bacterium]|nr:metal ABC transporter permease [Acidobacteriota bacterium]